MTLRENLKQEYFVNNLSYENIVISGQRLFVRTLDFSKKLLLWKLRMIICGIKE